MKISEHKSITATYEMYDITNGQELLLESTPSERPMELITGCGMTPLLTLEEHLATLATGDKYEITIMPEDAFGLHFSDRVLDIDKHVFSPNGELDETRIFPGAIVPLQNEQGQRFNAQIVSINENTVQIDLNHPLAGKTIKLKGIVLEAHEVSEEEVEAFRNQHSCGCGGGCSGGCEGDCNCSGGCSSEGDCSSDNCCGGGCGHCG